MAVVRAIENFHSYLFGISLVYCHNRLYFPTMVAFVQELRGTNGKMVGKSYRPMIFALYIKWGKVTRMQMCCQDDPSLR